MLGITESEFRKLANFIHINYGIYLPNEKKPLIKGRLHKLLIEKNLKDFSQYYEYVVSDKTGAATVELVNRITTNHTYFMRETGHFKFFRDELLPNLANTVRRKDLRIWSAGCSTGEEPYTLAMIIDEFFGEERSLWDTKILATDISTTALDRAKKGIYSNEEIAKLPSSWQSNYFRTYDVETSILTHHIRNEVIYRRFNLMDEVFPFKKQFHVIFCRNVMIYFDNFTRDILVSKFYHALEDGGHLFIGHSEAIDRKHSKFRYVMPAVYRKDMQYGSSDED